MTKELAYLLGYFYADGSLSCTKYKVKSGDEKICRPSPIIEIVSSDSEAIRNSITSCGFKFSEKTRLRKNSNNEQTLFRILGEVDIFTRVMTNKSCLTSAMSNISPEFYRFFLRGFFDGDGCINCQLGKYYRLYFYSSFDHNWDSLFSILNSMDINFTHNLIERKAGKHKSSQVCISNNSDIIKFFNYLYPDGIFDFGLLRKFEKLKSVNETSGNKRRKSSQVNVIKVFS